MLNCVLIECGNGGAVGPDTGGSAPTARRSSVNGNGSPASRSSNDNDIHRASGSGRDGQVSNFLRMDRMILHLGVCGSHGESRTSDGRFIFWIGRETVCRAHS